jgi:hypothetical protein
MNWTHLDSGRTLDGTGTFNPSHDAIKHLLSDKPLQGIRMQERKTCIPESEEAERGK